MSSITIQYRPLKWAMTHLHNRPERFITIVASRRAGKTVSSINHLIRSAITNKGLYAYVAPYRDQAKKVAWDIFKEHSKDLQPKYNEQELSVTYPNGGKILLLGGDNPDALRGLGLKGVIIDEVADLKEGVFNLVLLPTLAKDKGYAIFIGTPKGKDFFYELYKKGQSNTEDWYSVKLDVYEANNLDITEIQRQKDTMTHEQFMQEYMCDFDTAVNGAIYGVELTNLHNDKRITRVMYDPSYPVYTFWDLGYTDKTAIVWIQRVGAGYYIIDCFEDSGKTVDYYVNIVKSRGYDIDTNYLPHDAAHKTLSNNGISFMEQIEQLGLRCEIVPAPANKILAINSTRMRLKQCYIDQWKCEKLVEYLARYQWKVSGTSDRSPKHDDTSHMMDALSYFALTDLSGKTQEIMTTTYEDYSYSLDNKVKTTFETNNYYGL
jgi:phage terminase large subunit